MRYSDRTVIANVISLVFHPFILLPVFDVLLFKKLGLELSSLRFFSIIFLHLLLPLIIMTSLVKGGKITDYEITNREERYTYFLILTVCFALALFFSKDIPELHAFNFRVAVSMFVAYLITFKWKISGHTWFSTLIFLHFVGLYPNLVYIFLMIPLVGWSRIQLKKHTFTQTVAGVAAAILVYNFLPVG